MRVEGKARADRGRGHRQQHQRHHLHGQNRRERAQGWKDGAAKPQSSASSLLPDSRCVRGAVRQRAPPSSPPHPPPPLPGDDSEGDALLLRPESPGWGRWVEEPVLVEDLDFKLIQNRIPPVGLRSFKRHLDAAASRETRSGRNVFTGSK